MSAMPDFQLPLGHTIFIPVMQYGNYVDHSISLRMLLAFLLQLRHASSNLRHSELSAGVLIQLTNMLY